jgi:hypothetical protein
MALVPTSILSSTNATVNMEALQGATGNQVPVVALDSTRITYRASAANAAVITTTTKTILSITGSATKTVRIQRIGFTITAATAAQCVVQLQRTSALGTGGTAVSPSPALLDRGAGATYAAATAVVSHYTTGAQSQGTATGLGGPISSIAFSQQVTTTAPTFLGDQHMLFAFPENGMLGGSALVLRGASDFIELQTFTAIGTTPSLSYFVEWCEDNS